VNFIGLCESYPSFYHSNSLQGARLVSLSRALFIASEQPLVRPCYFSTKEYCELQAPSRSDPSAAEDGKDSVMVLLPVANMAERGGNAGEGQRHSSPSYCNMSVLSKFGVLFCPV
jgi:hypothetical protein